jgi:MFS family permease
MTPPSLDMRKRRAGVAISLIVIALFAGAAARSFVSPVQELLKADLGISDHQVALLQGFAYAVPTALLAIPIGRWVDQASRARLLLVLTLLSGIGCAVTAFAQDFTTMLAARMLVGASVAGLAPAALSLIADLVPADRRGKTFSLLVLGQIIGQSITFAAVGSLLGHPGTLETLSPIGGLAPWRATQVLCAAAMFAVAGLLMLLREPPRTEVGAAMGAGLGAALREMWVLRRLLFPMTLGLTAILMADTAAAIWAVPVLTRFLHQQPSDFGSWMAGALLLSGLGGAIVGGLVADLGQRKLGRAGVLMGATQACAISIPAALFPLANSVEVFACFFVLTMFAGAAVGVIASAATSVLFPNELRGLCVTLITAVGLTVSFGVAPALVTLIASIAGSGEDIRVPLAAVGVVASMVGTIAFRRAHVQTVRGAAEGLRPEASRA